MFYSVFLTLSFLIAIITEQNTPEHFFKVLRLQD